MSTTFPIEMRSAGPTILLYGQIGNSFYEDGVTAKNFAQTVNSIQAAVINIRVNSPGGALGEAMGMYSTLQALRQQGKKIITHNDAFALSAASLVLMAGDEIHVAESSFTMLHNPTLKVSGDYHELAKMAELVKAWTDQAGSIYAGRSGQSLDAVLTMMNDETWLDAAMAIEKGFATKLVPSLKLAAHFDVSGFQNAPAMLKEKPMPTVKEIRDACPGCDEKFIVAQMEAGATVQVAMTAWMGEQQKQIAALQAHKPAAGVDPLPYRGKPTAEFEGDAIAMFAEAVEIEMKSGCTRDQANVRVCRKQPELRRAYVAAHNALHGARR